MKHGYAAKGTTGPLSKVFIKFGIQSLEERAHERDLERRPSYRALLYDV